MSDLFVYGRDTTLARKHFSGEQSGSCAICGAHNPLRLALDHEHSEKGLCRGLLCGSCNSGLGMFHDDPAKLAAAIAYLERHDARNEKYEETDDWESRRVKRTVRRPRPVLLDEAPRVSRNERIVAAAHAGESAREISARLGVSLRLVYSVVKEQAAA